MEYATAAMERVPLRDPVPEAIPIRETIPQPPAESRSQIEDVPRFLLPFTRGTHKVFRFLCHTVGVMFLHLLSLTMLLGGVVAAVVLQIRAFSGVKEFRMSLLVACLLYVPSLWGIVIMTGHALRYGTSLSGAAPRMSHKVSLAYLVMLLCVIGSVLQPVIMRMRGTLPSMRMWISIAGTGSLYYCLLVSEVLFATALNVNRARIVDEELRRRERDDPPWVTGYHAVYSTM